MTIKTLHSLCTIFPRLDDQAFSELVEDIQQNGLQEQIVLLNDQVLDGRNRYHACLEAGVQAEFREFGSRKGDGTDPFKFVFSANAKRRHLTASQLAAAVAKGQDWKEAHAQGRSNQTGNVAGLITSTQRAAVSGASERTQRDADRVARESPELLDKVIAGEVSANAAAKQLRAAKTPVGGEQQGVPTEADFDSASQSDASSPDDEAAPAPAKEKPSKPADPRDARIAELEETIAELREALDMASDELDAYKAAATNEEAVKEILGLKGDLQVVKSQSREWMTKCNELVKQVKAQQKAIKRLESGR